MRQPNSRRFARKALGAAALPLLVKHHGSRLSDCRLPKPVGGWCAVDCFGRVLPPAPSGGLGVSRESDGIQPRHWSQADRLGCIVR